MNPARFNVRGEKRHSPRVFPDTSSRKGFTLVEVCVALGVLGFSFLAFQVYLDAYRRLCVREADSVEALLSSVDKVENALQNPEACVDSVVQTSEGAVFRPIRGADRYQWIEVQFSGGLFRRIVKCERALH